MGFIKTFSDNLLKAQLKKDTYLESISIKEVVRPQKLSPNADLITRFLTKIAFGTSDCWYWIGSRNTYGYGQLKNEKAHRVSWTLLVGPIPAGLFVLHKCDIRCCVNPDHLFLGTQRDNMRDMVAKGRGRFTPKRGEKNPQCRHSDKIIDAMRLDFSTGQYKQIELAKKYKISAMQTSRILRGLARK